MFKQGLKFYHLTWKGRGGRGSINEVPHSDDDDCADLITIAVFDKALVIEIDSKVMLNDLFSNSNHGTQ